MPEHTEVHSPGLPCRGASTAMGPKLRAPTEGEARAHKRQLELLAEDVKFVCAPDVQKPFSNLQDAVDRLIPFHVRERALAIDRDRVDRAPVADACQGPIPEAC